MSSTKRNAGRKFNIDYYVTPQDAIDKFLEAFYEDCRPRSAGVELMDSIPVDLSVPMCILDPCAGGNPAVPAEGVRAHETSYPAALRRWIVKHDLDGEITTVDIRPDSLAQHKQSYFSYESELHNFIITNPPFNIALQVIGRALEMVRDGGIVVMLLRLNFFGGQERSLWLKENMPWACYVHSKRMKISDAKSGDSIEYMHAVWIKGETPKFTLLRII